MHILDKQTTDLFTFHRPDPSGEPVLSCDPITLIKEPALAPSIDWVGQENPSLDVISKASQCASLIKEPVLLPSIDWARQENPSSDVISKASRGMSLGQAPGATLVC